MSNAKTILKQLSNELATVQDKIDSTLKNNELNENNIQEALDYLNDAIRKLDHAVEHLISYKTESA